MRIHTNVLTPKVIRTILSRHPNLPTSVAAWRLTEHGSRCRDRAYEVRLGADSGQDIYGKTRRPSMGGGYNPAIGWEEDYTEKALTWAEWGFFLADLFAIDSGARAGTYDGEDDFYNQTASWANYTMGEHFYPTSWASEVGDLMATGQTLAEALEAACP